MKTNHTLQKRIFSILLCLCMVLTWVPLSALAASEDFYIVAGTEELCGSSWDPTDTANLLVLDGTTGIYSKTYENVSGGTYEFKVVKNGAWGNPEYNLEGEASIADPNAQAIVEVDGSTVIIGFDGEKALVETIPPQSESCDHSYGEDGVCIFRGDNAGNNTGPATLYFNNSAGWETVYAYYWGGTSMVIWPGTVMTDVGNGIWSIEVPSDVVNIIFNNNGSAQTADLTIPTDGTNCYDYISGTWTAHTAGDDVCDHSYGEGVVIDPTCTEIGYTTYTCTLCGNSYTDNEVPATGHSFEDGVCTVCGLETMTIYFQNNWLWTDVSLYYWGSSVENPNWPGFAMELYGNDGTYDIYVLEIPTDIVGMVINGTKNDGTGMTDQTPDITDGWYDGICYYMTWNGGNQVVGVHIDEILPPAACDHVVQIIPGTAATCTEAGLTDGVECSVCGETITAQETIPATGHSYADDSCTVCGTTQTFTVTYAGYGVDYIQDVTAAPNTVITLPCRWYDLVNLEGKVFLGYNTEADGSGETYMDCTEYTVTGDVTLYTQWADIAIGDAYLNSGEYVDNVGNVTATQPEGGFAHFENGTLTLNNFTYSGEGYLFVHNPYYNSTATAAVYYAMGDLNVVLEGENTLVNSTENGDGLRGDMNVTVSGTGSLTAEADNNAVISSMAMTVESGCLTLTAGSYGIWASDYLTVNGGEITVVSDWYGVYANGDYTVGDININGGTLDLSGGNFVVCANGALNVTGGSLKVNASIEYAVQTVGGINIENVELLQPVGGSVKTDVYSTFTQYYIVDADGNPAATVVIGTPCEKHTDANSDGCCDVCGNPLGCDFGYHTEQTVAGKAPTCTEAGLTDGVICSVCDETITAQEIIPATGHGDAVTYVNNGGTHSATYDCCGEAYVTDEAHTYHTLTHICACGAESVAKNGIYAEDSSLYYYINDVRTYAGLIEIDGDYYYVRTSGEVVNGRSYWITKTNDLLPAASYYFGETGKLVDKNGFFEEDGGIYYYVNGERTYAGLIYVDGNHYYVRTSGQVVTGRSYWITKTNDLLPAASYCFDETGKMVPPRDTVKNGIYEESGSLFYYENGVRTYRGLLRYTGSLTLEDGTVVDSVYDNAYIYVRTSGEVVCGRSYWITKTNDLLPATKYEFDENGIMVNVPQQ